MTSGEKTLLGGGVAFILLLVSYFAGNAAINKRRGGPGTGTGTNPLNGYLITPIGDTDPKHHNIWLVIQGEKHKILNSVIPFTGVNLAYIAFKNQGQLKELAQSEIDAIPTGEPLNKYKEPAPGEPTPEPGKTNSGKGWDEIVTFVKDGYKQLGEVMKMVSA
jgi:hypothetical protein